MTDAKRTMIGSVISLSGDKSRVALIQRTVKHKLVGKIMKRSSKIRFHDEENASKLGDKVNLTVRDEVDVETSSIKINYRGLINSVKKGSKISVDNGLVNFKV